MTVHELYIFYVYGKKKVILQGVLYTVKLQMLIKAAFIFSPVCYAVAGWCLTTSQRRLKAGCQKLSSCKPFQSHH